MISNSFKKLCGALALGFTAAATAQAQPVKPLEYEVVEHRATPTQTIMLPEVPLPPPGPSRDQIIRYTPMQRTEYRSYLLLLRGKDGDLIQCGGVELTTNPYYYNGTVGGGDVELLANDRDVLQIMRRSGSATGMPARLGACVPVTPEQAAQVTTNSIGVKIGFTVEAALDFPLYGTETPAETIHKQQMRQNGRGISMKWATGTCPSIASGWNDKYYKATPGAKVQVWGICPP